MSIGKVRVIHLVNLQMKKISIYKMTYYPEPHSYRRRKINVEFDLFNYAAKTGVNKSKSC